MSLHKCNIYLSTRTDGRTSIENSHWVWVLEVFARHDFLTHRCDTVPGWWCLNQDWIEVLGIEMDIEWCSMLPAMFSQQERDDLLARLMNGDLIMMVDRINPDGSVEGMT
jgi:hypothetical protein